MTAEIVSVGTELLLGQIVDTDAPHLAAVLPEYGIACRRRQTVGDNLERATQALTEALARADLVFTIGGLGPTEDDLTREAIAAALELPLVDDDLLAERLRKLFALRKLPWTASQLRQCRYPEGARPIENPNGTAPGLICPKGEKTIIALPGPRSEFEPMVEGPIRAFLADLPSDGVLVSRMIRTCGIGESMVEEKIRHLIHGENPTVAPYAHPGEVTLRITARAPSREEGERLIEPVQREIEAMLGSAVYGYDETTLEAAVIDLLRTRQESLAVAESCTGGGLGARITSVAGSSDVFIGGAISYANAVKQELLGVSERTLDRYGAVSEPTAREMAEGARHTFGADWAVSITGIAGPGGGTPEKPVGLVFIGVAGPDGTAVEEQCFRGSRENVRQRSAQFALIQLRGRLIAKVKD